MSNLLPPSLLFADGERSLATLDGLARTLWLGGLTNSQGSLEPRLAALVDLRRELFGGSRPCPDDWSWPPCEIAHPLAAAIVRLDLPAYCAGKDELTDTVLMSILFHLDFIVDYRDRGAGEDEAIAMAVEAFASEWQQHCGEIDELVEVFGMVPDDCEHQRWDQMRGLLQSSGWREVLRIRRLLADLPELARIIRGLGRSRQSEEEDEASRTVVEVMEQAVARRAEARSVRVPDMPGETRGIHRSDRIARMLPAESILLGHPRLRLVWHARRAERTLLSYEDDDRMTEIRLHQAMVAQPRPGPQAGKRAEQGPMLVCVDTSGSMQGGAEAVAKAVVLEAVRCAHAQRRACRVYAFGGPDEVVEMELGVDAEGVGRLARFLGQGFGGGTDICGPLERAIARLDEAGWALADLLIASDGEFGATPALAARVGAARRERGLRVQGILIGDRETIGLLELADDIHWVHDWRRYGGDAGKPGDADADGRRGDGAGVNAPTLAAGGGSPVHSSHLTADYFPGALRTLGNRAATVTPEAAAAAIRAGRHRSEGP